MKKTILAIVLLLCGGVQVSKSQSNNPLSIYEGENVESVQFDFKNLPSSTIVAINLTQQIENTFKVYPNNHYNSFMADYYLSQIRILGFVESAIMDIFVTSENGVALVISVTLTADTTKLTKRANIFRDIKAFPSIYVSERSYLALKFASSQMAYSNNNTWFGEPAALTAGNPLADHPSGAGYTAWLEGFASVGLYGITKIIPSWNLHLYGGVSYLASFSLGPEIFTNKSRFEADIEDAFIGFIGGGRTAKGNNYRYNILYGRKQFILADGFLLINTSMNGNDRAALQLNPRWATKSLFQAGVEWNRLSVGIFRLRPNELPILSSNTVINGANLELGSRDRVLIGATFLQVPQSTLKYYMPDGATHTRQGLQVYNLRIFKSAAAGKGGIFFKAEGAYERNPNFNMGAFAFYGEIGWKFAKTKTVPTLSYRFAYFSGDDPKTERYERWDALYTGGNGEQWVQGSNMYKIVQNSNEITHRLQLTINPMRKIQVVTQLWTFFAPQTLNLGGNPALSTMKSRYYGSEINLTVKYFQSRHWYFHLNSAYTIAGSAIRDMVPDANDWFCLSVFARYSF